MRNKGEHFSEDICMYVLDVLSGPESSPVVAQLSQVFSHFCSPSPRPHGPPAFQGLKGLHFQHETILVVLSCSRYDFVEVEEQSETSKIIWGRWCGREAPPTLKSKGNMLKVTFKSDDFFVAAPGFKAYYSLLVGHTHLLMMHRLLLSWFFGASKHSASRLVSYMSGDSVLFF